TSTDKSIGMPPVYAGKEKLTEKETGLIRRWILEGAPWQAHWSFIAPKRPALPEVSDKSRVRNPLDAFVAARLAREGLLLSPEADRPTLIRRDTLDLTGVPPTTDEVRSFMK